MYKITGVVLIGLLIAAAVAEEVSDPDVLVLTSSNFDSTINSADLILVEFYAPWCGHCKKLAPEYAQAATVLKANDPPVLLGKVDATVDGSLAQRYGVSGYPTMKIFRKGAVSEYKGPRDKDGIVNYMLKQVGDSAKTLATVADFDKFVEHKDISVVGFFSDKKAPLYNTFVQVTNENRDEFRFGLVTDSKIMSEKNFGQGIVIFKTFDDKTPVVYSGDATSSAITDWVYKNSLPFIGEYTKASEGRYRKSGRPILKAFLDVDFGANVKRTNYYINRIKKAIEGNPGAADKLQFAVVNKKDFKDEMDKFGLAGGDISIAIDDFSNSLKYKLAKDFSIDSVKEFIGDYLAGNIKPFIKSQPIPDNSESAVKTVVGETFNDIVMDSTKDVLIELYAPWCGHCKNLEPVYKELAESLSGVDSVVIAKMDATANDASHGKYQARGYPTILFAPANNKENPIKFQGERTVKGFTDFLKQNSAIKWAEKKAPKERATNEEL